MLNQKRKLLTKRKIFEIPICVPKFSSDIPNQISENNFGQLVISNTEAILYKASC